MKRICILSVLVLLLLVMTACHPTPAEIINEPVRSMSEVDAALAKGNYEGAYRYLLTVKDDPKAAELLTHFAYVPHIVTDENGDDISVKEAYHYDSEGNWVSVNAFNQSFEYTYDEQLRLLTETYVYGGSRCGSVEYTYDEEGRLCSEVGYSEYGAEVDVRYDYDEEGRLIEKTDGDTTRLFRYDEEGRLIEETEKDNEVFFKRYEYDQNGNLVKETYRYSSTDELVTHRYEYDKNGRVVVGERDENGNMIKNGEMSCEWRIMYFPNGMSEHLKEHIESFQRGNLLHMLPNVIV